VQRGESSPRLGTPAKTTLFAGSVGWLRASPPRKFPQEIFANQSRSILAAQMKSFSERPLMACVVNCTRQ
jgi:hypothetical protein